MKEDSDVIGIDIMNIIRKILFEKKDTRPPFTKPPLRSPGESLESKLEDDIIGFALYSVSFPLLLLVILIYALIFPGKADRLHVLGLNLIVISPCLIFIYFYTKRSLRNIRTDRLGYLGEKIIGQELEKARADGYVVFHDIVIEKNGKKPFNIDHIAIGKAGIIVVETKAKSKSQKGTPRITYDGKKLVFPDGSYTSDPLDQVSKNSEQIEKLAAELISKEIHPVCKFNFENPVPTICIVAYPGWGIDFKKVQKEKDTIYVANDTTLVDNVISSFKQAPKLSSEMIKELQELFDRYLRKEKEQLIEY